MRAIVILIPLICIFSCSDEGPGSAAVRSLVMDISVFNEQGTDLLTTEYIDLEYIRLYHLINNEPELYYDVFRDSPHGYAVYQKNDSNIIAIGGHYDGKSKEQETIIQWSPEDSDTLKYSISRNSSGSVVLITEVWFNGESLWDDSIDDLMHIEIIKDWQ